MKNKHLKEIGVRGEIAIEIINELHTERLDYNSEYLPLINSVEDIPVLLSEINNLQSAQLKAFNAGYDVQQKNIDETVRQYGNEVDRLKKENTALRSNSDSKVSYNAYGYPRCVMCGAKMNGKDDNHEVD